MTVLINRSNIALAQNKQITSLFYNSPYEIIIALLCSNSHLTLQKPSNHNATSNAVRSAYLSMLHTSTRDIVCAATYYEIERHFNF